jgi:hypothetical protein
LYPPQVGLILGQKGKLSVMKRTKKMFDMESFHLKRRNNMNVKEQYQGKISNMFVRFIKI